MKKILVPTDFSDTSEKGLSLAIDIVEHMQAKIILLNVIYPPEGSGFAATGDVNTAYQGEAAHFMAALVRKNKARLEKLIGKYKNRSVEITPQIDFENKVHGLNNFVEENNVDLIVMGTRGSKSLTEYFIGSHTENIIKVSNCPVISIKSEIENFYPDSIVMAIDIKNCEEEEILQLQKFTKKFDSKVHFLHVLDDGIETDQAVKKLKSIAEKTQFANFTINTIDNENPPDAIMRYTKRLSADMLALVAEGKKGLKDLLFGSVTNDIINKIEIPVFVISKSD
ncbi:MAG: universal stress protein [Bacteroidales bacterium]|nr:universal stress protein [Bacteroidales bacterium]